MNQFTVLVLVLVVFCYCGGKYCPSILKQNKQILLGVVGGLVLASFFGFKLEGMLQKARAKDGSLVEIPPLEVPLGNEHCCAIKNEMEMQGAGDLWSGTLRPTDCAQDITCP